MQDECPTQRRPERRNGIIISKSRHDIESDPHLGRRLESRKGRTVRPSSQWENRTSSGAMRRAFEGICIPGLMRWVSVISIAQPGSA